MTENEIIVAVRKSKAAALRDWRHRNPEKVKAAQKRYWERRAIRELEAERREVGNDAQ